MIPDNYRFVFVLQSYLRPFPEESPYTDTRELAQLLIDRSNAGDAQKLYSNETLLYAIRKAYIKDNRYLVMLISCSDKNTSEPSFEDFNTNQVRKATKNDQEGQSYAAHMVTDLESLESDKPLNTVFLERAPGLSVSRIKMFLRHEIKQVLKKKYDVNGKEKNYTAIIELDGHASHTLEEALKSGTLKHVALVKHEKKQDGIDENDYIDEEKQEIGMKIKPDTISDRAIQAINYIRERFVNASDGKYDKMVVRIENSQGVTKQNVLELGDEEEDLLSKAFYRQERIDGFDTPLDASPTEIRDDVVAKMIGLAHDEVAE